jgi:uncharacterized lipoprotein YajG
MFEGRAKNPAFFYLIIPINYNILLIEVRMKIFNILLLILLIAGCGKQTDVLYEDVTATINTPSGAANFNCSMVSIEQDQVICYIKH